MFTTQIQVAHLLQVAEGRGQAAAVRTGLGRMVVASVGPTTSEALRQAGIAPDVEPVHPKMGFLVREAAMQADDVLRTKRGGEARP
jgi:uroporphyrinogen-III synthase